MLYNREAVLPIPTLPTNTLLPTTGSLIVSLKLWESSREAIVLIEECLVVEGTSTPRLKVHTVPSIPVIGQGTLVRYRIRRMIVKEIHQGVHRPALRVCKSSRFPQMCAQ